MQNAESYTHRGGYSDGGRSANFHRLIARGNFAIVGVGMANHFDGQAALVKHDDTCVGPCDGLGYVFHRSLLCFTAPILFSDREIAKAVTLDEQPGKQTGIVSDVHQKTAEHTAAASANPGKDNADPH